MRNSYSLLLLLSVSLVVAPVAVRGADTIRVLNAGGQSFTNVVVEQVTDTHLFFKYQGGVSSVKLADLDPEMQRKFGYNAAKGAQLLNQQAVAEAYFEARSVSADKAANGTANEAGTNDLKTTYGHIEKDFLVGKNGTLTLSFPNTWMFDAEQSADPAYPGLNLRFGPQYGSNFLVLVSTIPAKDGTTRAGPQKMMTMVAGHTAPRAVEKSLNLVPLSGSETDGYYFSFTDKALVDKEPKAGTYRYQTQGMVSVDDFALTFCVLFNYREGGEERSMLDMIRAAHFQKRQ
jgi:hypothetical protein